jgi:hypothetical protein
MGPILIWIRGKLRAYRVGNWTALQMQQFKSWAMLHISSNVALKVGAQIDIVY